jgi:hypothetical protein
MRNRLDPRLRGDDEASNVRPHIKDRILSTLAKASFFGLASRRIAFWAGRSIQRCEAKPAPTLRPRKNSRNGLARNVAAAQRGIDQQHERHLHRKVPE